MCVCVCVFDLHIFHTDPLVIGENGPYRHRLDTLLFLWRGKDGGNLTAKTSRLFHYTVCATCNVTSPSHGGQNTPTVYPKVLSEQNHANTCKHIHTHRPKQTKRADSWRLFPFIGPQSCGDVYTHGRIKAFMVQPISPGGLRTWLCGANVCVSAYIVGVWLEAQLKGSSWTLSVWGGRRVCLPGRSFHPLHTHTAQLGRRKRRWQLEVSVEHCVCEWHVSLILLRANLIAFHIIFIFQKQGDNYALERYWHSLEMCSIFSREKQGLIRSDTNKHT